MSKKRHSQKRFHFTRKVLLFLQLLPRSSQDPAKAVRVVDKSLDHTSYSASVKAPIQQVKTINLTAKTQVFLASIDGHECNKDK